jgi:hypothetical protein
MKTIKNFLWALLSDKSPLNPTVFIGVCAFGVMSIFALADVGTGLFGKELVITDVVYHAFVGVVAGAFLGGTITTVAGNKNIKDENPE